jgi:ABC-type sugar transport system ATPase subunit
MGNILNLNGIDKRYDGIHALKSLDLEFKSGEIHSIIGENGAGKSTLAKIICGIINPDKGTMVYSDREIIKNSPIIAQRLGISMVTQELDLFPNLTLSENIAINNFSLNEKFIVNKQLLSAFYKNYIEKVGLNLPGDIKLGDLSVGELQLISIARALSFKHKLIIMDEPTSALTEGSSEIVYNIVRELKKKNIAVIYISHNINEVLALSDQVTVLRDGKKVGTVPVENLNRHKLIKMMAGKSIKNKNKQEPINVSENLLEIQKLRTDKLGGINLKLKKGEILGVAGLVGSGRAELGDTLFGLKKIVSGTILIHNEPVTIRNPRDAIKNGIMLLPEDRKKSGLFFSMSIKENTSLSVLEKIFRLGFIDNKDELTQVKSMNEKVLLQYNSVNDSVDLLSGGNQQKVLLSKCLMNEPKILFLNNPTRGIDVKSKSEIYSLIHSLSQQGTGIILISSELEELIDNCHRIIVMNKGIQSDEYQYGQFSNQKILHSATIA